MRVIGPYALMHIPDDLQSLGEYYRHVLGPIERDFETGPTLLGTLEAYFATDCSLDRTARSLYVHKNTVRYRLRKISKLTGLDLNKFEDRVLLYLALKAKSVVAQVPPRSRLRI